MLEILEGVGLRLHPALGTDRHDLERLAEEGVGELLRVYPQPRKAVPEPVGMVPVPCKRLEAELIARQPRGLGELMLAVQQVLHLHDAMVALVAVQFAHARHGLLESRAIAEEVGERQPHWLARHRIGEVHPGLIFVPLELEHLHRVALARFRGASGDGD